jgi:S1-C subfamily serine protease
MLTEDGAFATGYHVVVQTNYVVLVVMTGDGRVAPVKEVLAANRRADVAILRAAGAGFSTVPLGSSALVGARVSVISHPEEHYFSLTEGLVSRYSVLDDGRRRRGLVAMEITADFARGSSGAPVFDECGAVVGVVSSTESVYSDVERGRRTDLQMVIKHCVPVRYLRDLIRDR